MAFIFVVENGVAKPNVETLLLSPFKEIWERDTTEHKEIAIKEFTFIELMSSKKKTNPYAGYEDDIRLKKLTEKLFEEGWEMDTLIEQGLAIIVEWQIEASPTYQYYISVLNAANQMRKFFNNFDINERNPKNGNPVYKPRDITSAINDTNKTLQNLNSMKESVEQELFESEKVRGNKTVNHFEI